MKAITILQPWASLIACGAKVIETRSWETKYRGPIAIHAGKFHNKSVCLDNPFYAALTSRGQDPYNLPYGQVIAIADLIACEKMTMNHIVAWCNVYGRQEITFGDFSPGRYAWILENVRLIAPVTARGQQRIWTWEP